MQFENYLIIAYSIVGFIALVGYVPQILKLIRSDGQSQDISINTWAIWSFEALVAVCYAVWVLQDLLTVVIFGFDVVCSFLILSLAIYNRVCNDEDISDTAIKLKTN